MGIERDTGTAMRPTQAQRREESHARLLAAAAEIIATEGFAAASFDRIGARAGYSRGLASAKFGSKNGLVTALIAHLIARGADHEVRAGQPQQCPLQRVLAYADTVLQQIESDVLLRAYWVMMAAAIGNRAPNQAAFLAEHEKVKNRLSADIAAGQGAGEIDPGLDPDSTALAIGSSLLGVAVECLLDPGFDIAKVRGVTLSAVARMLAPLPPP